MSVLIAIGTTAANSADVSVAAGKTVVFSLFDANGSGVNIGALAFLQKKASNNVYTVFDRLDSGNPVLAFSNPTTTALTVRVSKPAGSAFGVELDA
jgi:hypothetical protein